MLISGSALRRSASFLLGLFCFVSVVHAGEIKAIVQDASGANLRTGPGLSYPVVDILMAQTPLRIEGKNGDWYSVTTLEGEKGYVHQSLIETVGEPEAAAQSQEMPLPEAQQPVPSMPSSQTPAMPSNIESEAGTQSEPMSIESSVPTQPAETGGEAVTGDNQVKADQAKSPRLIDILEKRESELVVWAGIAVVFFLIGWISGGNYYLRRDRRRRTKLRF